MKNYTFILILNIFLGNISFISANEASHKTIIYGGIGIPKKSTKYISSAIPWSIGTVLRGGNGYQMGIDMAGEGTSFNSTSNKTNVVEQGLSFNLLLGKSLNLENDATIGVLFLMGARHVGKTCSNSYLGFECYANETPKSSYDLNYGAIIQVTHKKGFIGLRATGESIQGVFGIIY